MIRMHLFLFVLLGAGLLGPGPAHGAAIKKLVLTPSEAHLFHVWTNYLAQGPQTWSTTHGTTVSPAIRSHSS